MGEPTEERMMAEWARDRLEPGTYRFHVRLGLLAGESPGHLLPAEERAFHLVTLPEADLVIRAPGSTTALVVEFVVWRPQETWGQLLFYLGILTTTPGYEDVTHVQGRIVTGVDELRFRRLVLGSGLEYEVFRPAWLERALAQRRGGRP